MVSNIPAINYYNYGNAGASGSNPYFCGNAGYGNYNTKYSACDYSDDIMMPSYFKNPAYTQTQAQYPVQRQLGQNISMQAMGMQNSILAKDSNAQTTDNGNIYIKTNIGKKLLTVTGALAPVAYSALKAVSGASKAFNLKQLAIKCPVLAIAGLGVGALIDSIINSNRINNADNVQSVPTQARPLNYTA